MSASQSHEPPIETAASAKRKHDDDDDDGDGDGDDGARDSKRPCPDRPKAPKRKFAILCGYSGTGYHGMQIQSTSNVPTIEAALQRALASAGVISAANSTDLRKIGWSRAARTDRGVHAAGQVCVARLLMTGEAEAMTRAINEHLPAQIRVFGLQRVAGSYNAKNMCDSRRYEYLLPTFALDARTLRLLPRPPGGRQALRATAFTDVADLPAELRVPGIAADAIVRLRAVIARYEGTHNFHNFTQGMDARLDAAKRFIMSATVGEPSIEHGLEVVCIRVHGQSFMLHQIRRMVGLAVAAVRFSLSEAETDAVFARAFSREKIDVPTVPGNGLLLDRACFDAANRSKGPDSQVSFEPFEEAIANLKRAHIYPQMAANELSGPLCTFSWVRTQLDWLHARRYPELMARVTGLGKLDPELDTVPEFEDAAEAAAEAAAELAAGGMGAKEAEDD